MKKTAIDLPKAAFHQRGKDKIITVTSGDKKLSFIRGRENVILGPDKVTILFSDLNKKVRLPNMKKGQTAAEVIKEFNLKTYEKEVKEGKPQYTPSPKPKPCHPQTPEQKAIHASQALQALIASLPAEINVKPLQDTIFLINRIKAQLEFGPKNRKVGHRPAYGSGSFMEAVQSGHNQRKR